eukprot:1762776-Rhodomonas_salina.3
MLAPCYAMCGTEIGPDTTRHHAGAVAGHGASAAAVKVSSYLLPTQCLVLRLVSSYALAMQCPVL